MITAVESGKYSYVFMAKVSKQSKASKVKKPDVTIKLKEKGHEIISLKPISSTSLSVVYGNVFSMLKQEVSIIDEEHKGEGPPAIKSNISLKAPGEK